MADARILGRSIVLLVAMLPTANAAAQESRRYWVESFDADIRVLESGDVEVTERLRFHFEGSFNGIYRDLPVEYRTSWALDYDLRVEPGEITDDDGNGLRHEVSRRGDDLRFKVWVPDARDASRTVLLRYRVARALRFPDEQEGFEAHDQLYWNVTGTRWTVPILRSSATVRLPQGLIQEPWALAYTGPYGSRAHEADVRIEGFDTVVVETRGPLDPGEGLTVVVGWPPGVVHRPTATEAAVALLADNWPLGLPLLALVGMMLVHRSRGRDPDVNRSVMVRYDAPEGFRPAELGTLIDERVDLRDIVATVIDLAVRGYLRIEESDEKGWFSTSTVTTFVKLPAPADDELRPYERDILDGLFERGDRVQMDDLETRFYKHVSAIKNDLYRSMTDRGLFRGRPDNVRTAWVVGALVSIPILAGLGIVTGKTAFFFAAPLTAIAIGLFAPFMPARTVAGRRTFLEVKGFEEFLGRTEADRFRSLGISESAFEQWLPYAMAFGVADHWASLFRGLLTEPPNWYVGHHARFAPDLFSRRMGTMGRSLGAAMVSQPRASSSSGSSGFSSGGGFSGGGFGGGGGGAF